MSIQQQQSDEERRRQEEEAAALAKSLKASAYADYHNQRGTGTWRAWEHGGSYPGQGAGGVARYHTDGIAPLPKKESK